MCCTLSSQYVCFVLLLPRHSHCYSFRTAFTDLNLYWIKGALALFYFLATCARLSCILSFWVHVKLFYRIVSFAQRHCLVITFLSESPWNRSILLLLLTHSARLRSLCNAGLHKSHFTYLLQQTPRIHGQSQHSQYISRIVWTRMWQRKYVSSTTPVNE